MTSSSCRFKVQKEVSPKLDAVCCHFNTEHTTLEKYFSKFNLLSKVKIRKKIFVLPFKYMHDWALNHFILGSGSNNLIRILISNTTTTSDMLRTVVIEVVIRSLPPSSSFISEEKRIL